MGEQEYPQMVREALKRNEEERAWILEELLPVARTAGMLHHLFPGVHIFHGLSGRIIYVYVDGSSLKPVLKFLAEHGHRTTGRPTEYGDKQLLWEALPFQVWLKGDDLGPNCRWVKTGQKTEDVYELQCDEAVKARAMGLEPVGDA